MEILRDLVVIGDCATAATIVRGHPAAKSSATAATDNNGSSITDACPLLNNDSGTAPTTLPAADEMRAVIPGTLHHTTAVAQLGLVSEDGAGLWTPSSKFAAIHHYEPAGPCPKPGDPVLSHEGIIRSDVPLEGGQGKARSHWAAYVEDRGGRPAGDEGGNRMGWHNFEFHPLTYSGGGAGSQVSKLDFSGYLKMNVLSYINLFHTTYQNPLCPLPIHPSCGLTLLNHPKTPKMALLLQTDVTAKMELETSMQVLTETQLGMLVQVMQTKCNFEESDVIGKHTAVHT